MLAGFGNHFLQIRQGHILWYHQRLQDRRFALLCFHRLRDGQGSRNSILQNGELSHRWSPDTCWFFTVHASPVETIQGMAQLHWAIGLTCPFLLCAQTHTNYISVRITYTSSCCAFHLRSKMWQSSVTLHDIRRFSSYVKPNDTTSAGLFTLHLVSF